MTTRIRNAAVGITLVAALTTMTACGTPAEQTGPSSLTIGIDRTTYGLTGKPFGSLLYFGNSALFEPLIGWDTVKAEYIPWLAEDWTLSEDRLSWEFQLREDVDLTDGQHLDAQLVSDYLTIAFGPTVNAAVGTEYGVTTEVTGEYTFTLHTTKKIGPIFMGSVRDTGIGDPVAAADLEIREKVGETAGTGPYLIDESVQDVSISFVRNPDYWNAEAFPFDELKYIVFDDKIAAGNALRSGQIDATLIDIGLAADLESGGFTIVEGGGSYHTLLTLDFQGEFQPALGDVRVRQAMAMVFDGEAILESLEQGRGFLSDQAFGVGQPEYIEGADDRYPYDVERARELMAEAGYADGFDLAIPSCASCAPYPINYEPIVQQSLGEIGIRVTYDSVPDDAAIYEAWTSGEYPVMLVSPNYENTLDILVGDPPFLGHVADDPEWRRLIDLVQNGSTEESAAASVELGEYMLDQAWYTPIVHPAVLWAVSPEIDFELGRSNGIINLFRFTPAD